MAKIFVVTEGCYSDYRIIGIFSTREKALERCPGILDVDPNDQYADCKPDIEEWELDALTMSGRDGEPVADAMLQTVFCAAVLMSNGNTHREYVPTKIEVRPRDWSEAHETTSWTCGPVVIAESVVSAEHAHKVAVEHRQALLRERAIMPQPQ